MKTDPVRTHSFGRRGRQADTGAKMAGFAVAVVAVQSRSFGIGIGSVGRCHAALVLMLVMANMPGSLLAAFMAAIRRRRTPGELDRQNEKEKNEQESAHGGSVSGPQCQGHRSASRGLVAARRPGRHKRRPRIGLRGRGHHVFTWSLDPAPVKVVHPMSTSTPMQMAMSVRALCSIAGAKLAGPPSVQPEKSVSGRGWWVGSSIPEPRASRRGGGR